MYRESVSLHSPQFQHQLSAGLCAVSSALYSHHVPKSFNLLRCSSLESISGDPPHPQDKGADGGLQWEQVWSASHLHRWELCGEGAQLQVSGSAHGSMELQHHGGHEQTLRRFSPNREMLIALLRVGDCIITIFYSIWSKLFYFMLNGGSIYNVVPVSVKVALPGLALCQCTPWSHWNCTSFPVKTLC